MSLPTPLIWKKEVYRQVHKPSPQKNYLNNYLLRQTANQHTMYLPIQPSAGEKFA